jgi:nitroreductase
MEEAMQDILNIIQERHSLRMPFDPERPISRHDMHQILEAGRWAPTAHNMQNFEIIVVDNKKVLEDIGAIKNTVSEIFIRENYAQLSFSEEELLHKKVGILGTNFPPSWRTPGVKPIIEEGNSRLFQACPTLLIILYDPSKRAPASEGDFLGIISLGCMLENLWLESTSLGIDFHIVSSLGNDPIEKEVKHILDIPDNLRIVLSMRLGYITTEPSHTLRVRRDIEDFTHHNRFGEKFID